MITTREDRSPGQRDEAYVHAQFERESFERWQDEQRSLSDLRGPDFARVAARWDVLAAVSEVIEARIGSLVPDDFEWRLEYESNDVRVLFWLRGRPERCQRLGDQDMSIAISFLVDVRWDEVREKLAECLPAVRQETVAYRSCA